MSDVIPEERRSKILALVAKRHQVSVNELADVLGASRETVRRDLAELDERGLLRRVHGGAVDVQAAAETGIQRRRTQHLAEKQRIARAALSRFAPGDTLFIDAGTTTAVFAEALRGMRDLTVITNSIDVASRLWAPGSAVRVYLLGGLFNGEVPETVGPQVVEQIQSFRADHAVLTVGAIDAAAGIMDFSLDEAAVARAMVRNARSTTVLADHSKFNRSALAAVCALQAIACVVTDEAPPDPVTRALRSSGVKVIVG